MLNRSVRGVGSAILLTGAICLGCPAIGLGWPDVGAAQTGPAPAPSKAKKAKPPSKLKFNPYGSPLETIMKTRLWTDVPPAEDFVKASRPDPKSLDYTPLTGKDPERPKLRDKANILALQAELEQSVTHNEHRAKALGGVAKPKTARKSSAASP